MLTNNSSSLKGEYLRLLIFYLRFNTLLFLNSLITDNRFMGKKLLIVDDDKNVAEVIQESLTELFDSIDRSLNVDSALEFLQTSQYDLIILDINLDGRNGAEIIKFLVGHNENVNQKTPVFIISGIINQHFLEKNKQRFAGILIKPFDINELLQTTMVILQGRGVHNVSIDLNINYQSPFENPQLEQKISKVFASISANPKVLEALEIMQLHELKNDNFTKEIGLVINIAITIANSFEWGNEKTLEKLILAALIHNYPLKGQTHLQDIYTIDELEQKKSLITKEEYELIYQHPNIAADKILQYPEIAEDVAMIVRQHHENPKERGFPNHIGHLKISPLSSIFIVAQDMAHDIMKKSDWTLKKYLDTYKMKFKGPHFQKIFNALASL